MDIPTGQYVKGLKGENILNGGLGVLTAIAGHPNRYKSTIGHYMILSAASKIADSGYTPYINTLDTEMNIHTGRLTYFSHRFDQFKNMDIIENGIWSVTDITKHLGNEWFKILRDFLRNEKVKKIKDYTIDSPFITKDGKAMKVLFPTFGQVDSLSKFVTADIEEIQNKNQIGDSGGNTIHMRAGLAKARLLMELPILCNSSAHYMLVTTHVGQDNNIGGNPYAIPTKKLQHMKQGEKIKGAPDDFFFLTNNLWQAVTSSALVNQGTKGPEYPKHRDDQEEGSGDLNVVTLRLLRNKSGPSGHTINIVLSQREGVLDTLTEFYYIKENDRYGLEGNNINYKLDLYPDVNLTRTTIRNLIDSDSELRRAIKITADLLQIKTLYKELPFEIPTPKQLYEKLSKEFDWKVLLNTRDYWTFNQYTHPVPFLSTLDIIELYYGIQKAPFWYDSKKIKEKQ